MIEAANQGARESTVSKKLRDISCPGPRRHKCKHPISSVNFNVLELLQVELATLIWKVDRARHYCDNNQLLSSVASEPCGNPIRKMPAPGLDSRVETGFSKNLFQEYVGATIDSI
jgi:hypothetical protein